MKYFVLLLSILLCPSSWADDSSWFQAGTIENESEFHLEAGLGLIIFSGPDFQVSYRPSNSRWLFGYRYIEADDDEIFGFSDFSNVETELGGPNVRYIFAQNGIFDFYAQAGYYELEYELECNINSTTVTESETSLNLGGGVIGNFSDSIKFNASYTFATGGKFDADAGACRDEGIRGDDVIFSIVFVF